MADKDSARAKREIWLVLQGHFLHGLLPVETERNAEQGQNNGLCYLLLSQGDLTSSSWDTPNKRSSLQRCFSIGESSKGCALVFSAALT